MFIWLTGLYTTYSWKVTISPVISSSFSFLSLLFPILCVSKLWLTLLQSESTEGNILCWEAFSIETFISYFFSTHKRQSIICPLIFLKSALSDWSVNSWPSLIALPHSYSPIFTLWSTLLLCLPSSVFIQRLVGNWWGSALAWSICSDVVQREGPALIYYTCQLNVWRYILTNKSWILYAASEAASLILISSFIGDCATEHWVTSAHSDRDCWWMFNV